MNSNNYIAVARMLKLCGLFLFQTRISIEIYDKYVEVKLIERLIRKQNRN
jgi:hypothetical protein